MFEQLRRQTLKKMVQNYLLEINRVKLPQLRELYRVEWPKYVSSFLTIDTCIRWFSKNPRLKDVKVFCLNGRIDDGTFIMIVSRVIRWKLLLLTPLILERNFLVPGHPSRILWEFESCLGVDRLVPALHNFQFLGTC